MESTLFWVSWMLYMSGDAIIREGRSAATRPYETSKTFTRFYPIYNTSCLPPPPPFPLFLFVQLSLSPYRIPFSLAIGYSPYRSFFEQIYYAVVGVGYRKLRSMIDRPRVPHVVTYNQINRSIVLSTVENVRHSSSSFRDSFTEKKVLGEFMVTPEKLRMFG